MNQQFTPLDSDVRDKNLVYVSKAKLNNLLLDKEKPGFGVNVGGLGFNVESRILNGRELLNKAAKHFEQQKLLETEENPRPGRWLLLRAVMKCGTAWPWAYSSPDMEQTAWWIGNSESLRILAYGNRRHLLDQGGLPLSSGSSERVATWWPSGAGAYLELLKNIGAHTATEAMDGGHLWSDDQLVADQVQGLEGYFFNNAGVERHDPLVSSGIFELMLRVDKVIYLNGRATVLGSPLWVSREYRSVPGVYAFSEDDDKSIRGDWDGFRWCSFEVTEKLERKIKLGLTENIEYLCPESLGMQLDAPQPEQIIYLGPARWDFPDRRSDHNEISWLRRLFKKGKF